MPKTPKYHWSSREAATPKSAPIAHYPDVRVRAGRWQAYCACGWFGQLRAEWVDANTDGAVHAFNARARR